MIVRSSLEALRKRWSSESNCERPGCTFRATQLFALPSAPRELVLLDPAGMWHLEHGALVCSSCLEYVTLCCSTLDLEVAVSPADLVPAVSNDDVLDAHELLDRTATLRDLMQDIP